MPDAQKDLAYYLALRYPTELTPDSEGGYFARHPDLAGCASQGDTIDEALSGLREARELWLENKLLGAERIPEPLEEMPSGRLMLRVPLCLHSALEETARDCDLSLNRLLNEVLFNHANYLPLEYGLKRLSTTRRSAPNGQTDKSLEHYLALRYPITLTPSEEGEFLVEHLDLPGCAAQGESAEEAVAELNIARELWLSSRYEEQLPIPAPLPLDHTGIINLRIPPALHYHLARHAGRNGVSLNYWLVMALSRFAGTDRSARIYDSSAVAAEYEVAQNRLAFLSGLRSLKQRHFVKAFESFFEAYRGGLNFSTTAADIYRSMPDPISHQQLHELLFELSQIVPGDTPDKREVHFLLVAWLQEVKDEPLRQEEWLAYDREARSLTAA